LQRASRCRIPPTAFVSLSRGRRSRHAHHKFNDIERAVPLDLDPGDRISEIRPTDWNPVRSVARTCEVLDLGVTIQRDDAQRVMCA
jgi:hypothetical protein